MPSIAMLVNVANIPPAGVKAPYIHDWNAAASVPSRPLADIHTTIFRVCCFCLEYVKELQRHTRSDTNRSKAQAEYQGANCGKGNRPG